MATQGIERIPDSLGYLVLNEDGAVLSSGGDLENDESRANQFMNIVHTACKLKYTPAERKESFRRLSVIWEKFMYVITISNHRVYISKRRYNPQEAVLA